MELGALVCRPSAPHCADCPLAKRCAARLRGIQDQIPLRNREAAPTQVRDVALALRRGAKVLLVQRPALGRWANLWEFPHTPISPDRADNKAAARLLTELGMQAELGGEITRLAHSVTRYRITLTCFAATYRRGRFKSDLYIQARWLSPSQIAHYPVSSPQRPRWQKR